MTRYLILLRGINVGGRNKVPMAALRGVLVLARAQRRAVVRDRPKGFGDQPDTYNSDAVFLMGIDAAPAMKVFDPRPGVDEVWPGKGVIYSQRLSAQRTKSRLGKMVGPPAPHTMTT